MYCSVSCRNKLVDFHCYPFQLLGNPFFYNVLGGARVEAVWVVRVLGVVVSDSVLKGVGGRGHWPILGGVTHPQKNLGGA